MLQLTEDAFEQVVQLFNEAGPVSLLDVSFIDPHGMVGILEIGEILKAQGVKKTLCLPQSEDVIKYLERMDFFKFAADYFNLEPVKPQLSEKYHRSAPIRFLQGTCIMTIKR